MNSSNVFIDGCCDFPPWRPVAASQPLSKPISSNSDIKSIDLSDIKNLKLQRPGDEYQSWSVVKWQKVAHISVLEYLQNWVHWECFLNKVLYDSYLPLLVKKAIIKRVSTSYDHKPHAIKHVPEEYILPYIIALAQVDINIGSAISIFHHIERTLSVDDYVYTSYAIALSILHIGHSKVPREHKYLAKKDVYEALFWLMKSSGAANGENVTDPDMDHTILLKHARNAIFAKSARILI